MIPHASDAWVLVPGTLCTGEVFAPILDRLGVAPARRHVLMPDAPAVTDYGDRLRAAVQGGEIVCGFSLGALILSHNLPALARARALVLLAANPHPDPPENRAGRLAVRDRVLAGEGPAWVAQNWEAMSTDRGTGLRDRVAVMAAATASLIPAQTDLAASRPGAAEALRATHLPTVFVTGAEDRMTPPDMVCDIARDMPRATLAVPDGLGHFALLEDPDRVAQAIRDGLAQVLSPNPEDSHGPQTDPSHVA